MHVGWLHRIARSLESQGWTLEVNKHFKFHGPAGQRVVCAGSPKDRDTARRRVVKDFAQAGVDISHI